MSSAFYFSISLILISLLVAACSSTHKLDQGEQKSFNEAGYICKGDKAKQIFVYTISSFFKPEKGMLLEQAHQWQQRFNNSVDRTVNGWILHLLAHQYRLGPDNELLWGVERDGYTGAYDSQLSHYLPISEYTIFRKNNSFVVFSADIDGLVDPVTGLVIKDNFDIHNYGTTSYAEEMKFYGGSFLTTYYFSIPERDRPLLCKKAGLPEDCFNFPTSHKALRQVCSGALGAMTHTFFKNNYGNCYHENAMDARADLMIQMKKDNKLKLMYDSALASDLFLKIGVNITKTFKDGWKIHRIEWDPGLFCKYKRPQSDFYVQ